ncbi:MAG: hypothetical protein R3C14_23085 [Caldilineaceae bacterium]
MKFMSYQTLLKPQRILFSLLTLFGALFAWSLWPATAHAATVLSPLPGPLSSVAQDTTVTSQAEAEMTALTFVQVVAGDNYSCGLAAGGAVTCWGNNGDGQIGDNTELPYRPPVAVSGLAGGVQQLAGGGSHVCALLTGGSVKCWGSNGSGQLGDGSTSQRRLPVDVISLPGPVVALAAGGEHTCAVLQSGAVACWGKNTNGQLGNNGQANLSTPALVVNLAGSATAVVAGANHSCALLQGGAVRCWGDNAAGQLGDGTNLSHNTPVAVSALAGPVAALGAGANHTCAALTDGRLQCWGDNARGQLGDGSRDDRTTPVFVQELKDVIVAVAAGRYHTCALSNDGDLYCWGANNRGQLGDGTLESSRTPLRVRGLPGDTKAVAAGLDHVCAILLSGAPYCWGSNRDRQLGQGAPAFHSVPFYLTAVENTNQRLVRIPTIVAGRYHTCMITASRGVQCWGRNSDGQLGDGTILPSATPMNVVGLASGVIALALGAEHTCALLQNGTVKCWGNNAVGQLGDGSNSDSPLPVDVTGLTGAVVALAAGENHTCALLQSGAVKCWGENTAGQLGDGTTTNTSFPVNVLGLNSGVVALTAGIAHSCALVQGGAIQCWGDNSAGQLGDGTLLNHTTPVAVAGLPGAAAGVDAGGAHTCAVLVVNVACWGSNRNGQLGDGSKLDQTMPVTVTALPARVTAIAAGISHTCGLTVDGGVTCWGSDEYGQLGDGATTTSLTPVMASGLQANVLTLSAGGYHNCVLVGGNRPLCWGRDSDGQLASGVSTQSTTPVTLVESYPAQLYLGYPVAKVGSTLTLLGTNLPYSATLPIVVNGVTLSDTLQVTPAGEFILHLATATADAGAYTVEIRTSPKLTTHFFLDDRFALRPTEGEGNTVVIPAGISTPILDLYFPIASK